ncbi:F-box/FBD/LRR-repeat protein At1g13570-like [Trifolium pratense]|uniref:F-box/FBD/LRR-repeat protein At1g13570-like n=1 Tax=Trifolium pratense TaxID=57577 RepID=UPI001E6969BC|nr:F-box/FBD/LRR-repeat protein At1g13570-like [Trifolium pratense]
MYLCLNMNISYLKETKSTPREVIDVEPDRISCLPGHLIDCILSYLPIKEAVRTNVLSNKWRNKWYTLPNLVFDEQCVSHLASEDPLVIENKFLKIVDHVLLVHSGVINMFKFVDYENLVSDSADIDRWILHLTGRSIKELVVEVCTEEHYKIPWCLFSCQSLQCLKLHWCGLKPPTTFEGFKNMKSIHLSSVMVAQDVLENLICGCPQLEELKLTHIDGLYQINIHAPNLKFFEIYGKFGGVTFDNTFQLAKIVITSWFELNSESNQSRLHGSSSNMLKFFDHLPHIQSLEIGSDLLKYLAAGVLPVKLPTPCIHLSYLSLCINLYELREISAALCLLKSSPNLRKLEMFATVLVRTIPLTPATYCWEDIFSVPTTPFQVRHMRIVGISDTKLELEFIKFLLLYSPVLKKMTVMPVANVVPELMKALIRFKRASGEAEVIWQDPFEYGE